MAAAIVGLLLLDDPAAAEEPMPVWKFSLYETVAYRIAANLADIPLYAWLVGGTAPAVFAAANVTTAAGTYYLHEFLWNRYGPYMQENAETALSVGTRKLILYRVLGTTRNLALAYALSGTVPATLTFTWRPASSIRRSMAATNMPGMRSARRWKTSRRRRRQPSLDCSTSAQSR
jgi:hypothetical protein